SVLPAFLEFARGAVLVAHNAGFDVGFLRAAAARCQVTWPRPPVLCTVRLARRVLTRDEAPSVRLSALARLFGAATTPTHRALDDARATVDVLHALIERVGNQGVHTYTDLRAYLPDVTPAQRRNRHLAIGLPHRPGVYLFRGPSAEVLYVGTAVDLRRRVGQYFSGADPRTRIKEMASLATGVDHVECAHDLEAGVRELRLLAAHAPPYNRRSKFPHRWWWVSLTDEAFPRFSTVRVPKRDTAIGPFRSRADAVETAALLARFTGVRTCTARHHADPVRLGPRQDRRADRGQRRPRTRRGAGAHRRPCRAQPLRDRRPVAGPGGRGDRRALARPTPAGAGRSHRNGGRPPRRRRWMAPRGDPARPAGGGGHCPPRGATDAGRRRHLCWRTGGSTHRGATGRCAGGGDRADRALARPTRCAHRPGRTRLGLTRGIGGTLGGMGGVRQIRARRCRSGFGLRSSE